LDIRHLKRERPLSRASNFGYFQGGYLKITELKPKLDFLSLKLATFNAKTLSIRKSTLCLSIATLFCSDPKLRVSDCTASHS
jgi:hypothetical protein